MTSGSSSENAALTVMETPAKFLHSSTMYVWLQNGLITNGNVQQQVMYGICARNHYVVSSVIRILGNFTSKNCNSYYAIKLLEYCITYYIVYTINKVNVAFMQDRKIKITAIPWESSIYKSTAYIYGREMYTLILSYASYTL